LFVQQFSNYFSILATGTEGEAAAVNLAATKRTADLIAVRAKLREAEAAMRLRTKVIQQAVTDNWDVADEFELLEKGVAENPNLAKARKNVADKRKKSAEALPKPAKRGKWSSGPSQRGGYGGYGGGYPSVNQAPLFVPQNFWNQQVNAYRM
jgi:hypothetical protein